MNIQTILKVLVGKGLLSDQQSSALFAYETSRPFSIHWELRSVLYIGILLFSSGTGIVIYENIDTIGHQVIIAAIALLTAYCFYYAIKFRLPFSFLEVSKPNHLFDYVVLLGCTTFLALEGYLQFQYNLFGSRYGLAVIIPTIFFFISAYCFDHRGALSMGIAGLASWLGLTIAPLSVLSGNDFTDEGLLISAIILGIALVAVGWLSQEKNLKAHFSFPYLFMGGNLASLAALIGLFAHPFKIVYASVGLALSVFFTLRSRNEQSLLFLLMGVVYGYIIITYSIFSWLGSDAALALGSIYFMLSSAGVIIFLLKYKVFLGIKK
jgi:hypothetical protein